MRDNTNHKGDGLGSTLSSSTFTFTGLTVGRPFMLNYHVNNAGSFKDAGIKSTTGFNTVDVLSQSDNAVAMYASYVCMATSSTIVIQSKDVPERYLVSAYQYC